MKLRVVTTNGQEGPNSVETVEVFDGDQLLATINKTADERAEVKVYEALLPDLKGAFVEIQNGADVAVGVPASQMIDVSGYTKPKRKINVGK